MKKIFLVFVVFIGSCLFLSAQSYSTEDKNTLSNKSDLNDVSVGLRCLAPEKPIYVPVPAPIETLNELIGHLELDLSSTNNLYKVAPSTTFRVKAKVESPNMQSLVRIGLFSTLSGDELVADITSKNLGDGYYECKVPSGNVGNFILAAYAESDGVFYFVNRKLNTISIDKLPLLVEGTTSERLSTVPGYLYLTYNLELNNSVKASHTVNTNRSFTLYAPIDGDVNGFENKRVMLLSSAGYFVCDITTYRQGNVYSCEVPSFVASGDYVIMLYKIYKVDGVSQLSVVERELNTQYIDCLPIKVVNSSVRSESLTQDQDNSLSVTVYPNPASDFLRVKGLSETAKIEIFNLSGGLVKVANIEEGGSLDIQSLPSGVYVAKITTVSGKLYISKIKKK